MIYRFLHKGLKRLHENDDRRGLHAQHVDETARILAHLKRSAQPQNMDIPGFRLRPLRGDLPGY